jgi:hypothetical protein
MVSGKRRTISVERLVIAYPSNRVSELFTSPDYPWHLYILHLPERNVFVFNPDGRVLRHVIKEKCISFKYNGLTCKVCCDTDNIHIHHGDAIITIIFDRVMTIEEIAYFLESEIINAVQRIKRAIRLGVGVIRGKEFE